ncbi:transglutaminaseTgpA domain-containing protein [Roseateles sp. DB2]|uniref:transglutaminase family protein n=1 Tax=Roseateles sp. DB2 TaxID=3453717 RepID=UPI003EED0FE2
MSPQEGKTWPWQLLHWRPPGREARDTFFLLGLITATLLPHADHLPAWCLALAGLVLGWRAWLAASNRPLPGRWTVAAMLGVAVLSSWLQFRTLLGREAGIALLVLLMGLKTLELRARRDAFVVFFLGFFLVLTHFLYSQSLLTALWTLACTWGLLTALVLAQMPLGQPHLALAARQAARVTLLGLPVMVALFLLFPRIGPLWGIPADGVGRTGLSDRLQFGAMSEIANDQSIAMRLRVLEGQADPRQWYFRGPVLSEFDGQLWTATDELPAGEPAPESALRQGALTAPRLRYELTLEPLRIRILPMLELDPALAGETLQLDELRLLLDREHVWRSRRPISERLRFQHAAHPAATTLPQQLGSTELADYLALPPGLNPRSQAFARALSQRPALAALAAHQRPAALAEALLQHLHEQPFSYTLSPGRYGEQSPHLIDEFWFDRRLGFCEHFASAFVVMMRAMGVPARIVTGYQGADPEPQDGFWVIRQSQAHAWAEYWEAGKGWVRVDPTAAVAPNRIQRGLTLEPPPGLVGSMLGTVSPDLWRRLRNTWETLDNRWQQWVLGYTRQDQFQLLSKLGFNSPDWTALGQLAAGLIATVLGLALAWNAWQSRPHDAWTRQRLQVQRDLARLGVRVPLHLSYAHWAAALETGLGPDAQAAAALLRGWDLDRYGARPNGPSAPWRSAWRQALRRIGRRR